MPSDVHLTLRSAGTERNKERRRKERKKERKKERRKERKKQTNKIKVFGERGIENSTLFTGTDRKFLRLRG